MIRAYRLFRSRYEPWDATGAKLRGGRWNSPGTEAIYASDCLALACLEVLVHVRDPYFVPDFSYCAIDAPDDIVSFWEWGYETLGKEGRAVLQSEVLSREYGDRWLQRGKALLCVPSVIIPEQRNYLINPNHADFHKVRWSEMKSFSFEPRLINPALR